MRIIAYYTGSDARWLTETQPTDARKIPYILAARLRAWLLRPLVREYWVDDEYLAGWIRKFKPDAKTRVVRDELWYPTKMKQVPHKGINVAYYMPRRANRKYAEWCYGKDVVDRCIRLFPEFNWMRLDGNANMEYVYPYLDFYVRPNRHDGASRLVQECRLNDIPVYHTQHDPDFGTLLDTLKKLRDENAARD